MKRPFDKRFEQLSRKGDPVAPQPAVAYPRPAAAHLCAALFLVFVVIMLVGGNTQSPMAQGVVQPGVQQGTQKGSVAPGRLPSAEKVVDSYLKTIGGKKRVAAIRDATYEWQIQLKDQMMGLGKTQTKIPSSVRTEMSFGNGQVISAATSRSAWTLGLDGKLRTLTEAEAAAARLQAVLDASHLLDIKKSNVLARVVSLKDLETGPAYVVEFSLRSGARLRYLFSPTTRLLVGIEDDTRKTTIRFEDYRAEGNILEPHRVSLNNGGSGELTFLLQRASYNAGISDAVFDPPRGRQND